MTPPALTLESQWGSGETQEVGQLGKDHLNCFSVFVVTGMKYPEGIICQYLLHQPSLAHRSVHTRAGLSLLHSRACAWVSQEHTCRLNVWEYKRKSSSCSPSSLTLQGSLFHQEKKNGGESNFSYNQRDFTTLPATDEVAICLVILCEPQSNQEPTASLPMCLAGAGLVPSNHRSPGKSPSLATFSRHASTALSHLLTKRMEMPRTFLILKLLKLPCWVRL